MLDKIYVLNYYTWDREKKKIVGNENIQLGYFTSKELAMAELIKIVEAHPKEKVRKGPWWYVLEDKRDDCSWNHTYEIFEVELNKSAVTGTIGTRIELD